MASPDFFTCLTSVLDGKAVCIPEEPRINGNLAVYGSSGSMKTRSFCMNRILQAVVRGESLIISDPKSELYEKSSEYLRDQGYCVKIFNLVSPENSDSWNCLSEVEGQELLAQIFVDVIIKNTTNNGKSDHFWDSCEMNLLKALVLYVDQSYAEQNRNIGEVYRLLTLSGESDLDSLFENLPPTHPAKAPYSLYKQASDTVRSGVIIGLGSRLQVFQSELIKKITTRDEIDLEHRYPLNLWQEILGNCDAQLFLGCTDELTAEFISSRTGLASVSVSSKSKQLGTWRISNYTPEYRETSGVGKRPVLTPDEVLRLPITQALVIIRGQKVLKVDKMDYSKHPEASKLRSCKASAHIPDWQRAAQETPPPSATSSTSQAPTPKKPVKKKPKAATTSSGAKKAAAAPVGDTPDGIITTDKDSILS